MFQFPRLPPAALFRSGGGARDRPRAGSPIRAPPDRRPCAPPRGLSRLAAPFVGSPCQGIRRAPWVSSRPALAGPQSINMSSESLEIRKRFDSMMVGTGRTRVRPCISVAIVSHIASMRGARLAGPGNIGLMRKRYRRRISRSYAMQLSRCRGSGDRRPGGRTLLGKSFSESLQGISLERR